MPGKKRGAKREGLAWPTRVTCGRGVKQPMSQQWAPNHAHETVSAHPVCARTLADGSNGLFAGCTTSSPRLWSRTMYRDSMRPDVSMGTNEGTARGSASQSSTASVTCARGSTCVCSRWLYNSGAGTGSCKSNSSFGHMNEGTPMGAERRSPAL
eukprot:scaffold29010_cov25-Tisochrysis_lutea.AAC.2